MLHEICLKYVCFEDTVRIRFGVSKPSAAGELETKCTGTSARSTDLLLNFGINIFRGTDTDFVSKFLLSMITPVLSQTRLYSLSPADLSSTCRRKRNLFFKEKCLRKPYRYLGITASPGASWRNNFYTQQPCETLKIEL